MGRTEIKCDCEAVHVRKVNKVKKELLDSERLSMIADFYKALSDDTRIKIVNVLENNELCVCDIAVVLNMTKSAISHQLKYLRELNIVSNRKVGKEVLYSLVDDHVRQIFNISCFHIGGCYHEEN